MVALAQRIMMKLRILNQKDLIPVDSSRMVFFVMMSPIQKLSPLLGLVGGEWLHSR